MFFFYEKFKAILTANKRPEDSDLPYRVVSGAAAGIISNTLNYWLDPVKAVMSSDFNNKAGSMSDVIKQIYRQNGIKGFYHGWAATMCTVTPFIGKLLKLIFTDFVN